MCGKMRAAGNEDREFAGVLPSAPSPPAPLPQGERGERPVMAVRKFFGRDFPSSPAPLALDGEGPGVRGNFTRGSHRTGDTKSRRFVGGIPGHPHAEPWTRWYARHPTRIFACDRALELHGRKDGMSACDGAAQKTPPVATRHELPPAVWAR
jgi:hypothetical protein